MASVLIAVAGEQNDVIKNCEKYLIAQDKWVALPPLKSARRWPGSMLMTSMKAFSFCGEITYSSHLNEVETTQIGYEDKWITLPLSSHFAKTLGLAGVQFQGKILVFGGTQWTSFNIHTERGRRFP